MSIHAYLPQGENRRGVNLAAIVRNATDEGVDVSEIALLYEDLTDTELSELKRHGLYADHSQACVRGRFTKEGLVLFPEKVASILHL
ncbi:MAG: hypothetical protein RIQ79_1784 [Verrucomicrobiota bacterium]|jgi:hypothetical protein